MTTYIGIEHAVQRLQQEFDWYDSFIRELYFSTLHCYHSYKSDAGMNVIGDTWAPLDLRLVIAAAGSPVVFGVEFLCHDVQGFSLQRLDELAFESRLERDRIYLNFANASARDGACWVVAKEVRVAFLGSDYLGPFLRLGNEVPRDDAKGATMIDKYWRQCSHCSNAWIERPEIEYSRCPDCGELTRVVSPEKSVR